MRSHVRLVAASQLDPIRVRHPSTTCFLPQLTNDPRAAATGCASKRACVTSFPTLELDGILFAWLDASKERLAAASAAPKPALLEEGDPEGLGFGWFMNELPADYP